MLAGISVLFIALTVLLRHFINRLEAANNNLAQLNTELEDRVAARTMELQEANQQLALTNQELEAFTASASHDLRSPLGTIAGQAGLLRDELRHAMTDMIRQRIDRIQSNVMRSSEIIDGLLSLARVSRQELLNERVDVTALARSIAEDLRREKLRTRMVLQVHDELIFEVPEDELHVKDRIRERMQNVVELRVPLTVNLKQGRNWQNLIS